MTPYRPDRDGDDRSHDEHVYEPPDGGDAVGPMQAYLEQIEDHTASHRCYDAAVDVVEQTELRADDLEAALPTFEDDPAYPKLGYLFGAVYNEMEEDVIVFDPANNIVTEPLEGIGYALAEDRVLILEEPVMRAGEQADGTVVNRATARTDPSEELDDVIRGFRDSSELGRYAHGTVINEGTVDHLAPEAYGSSVTINDGEAKLVGNCSPGPVLNYGDAGVLGEATSGLVVNRGRAHEIGPGYIGVVVEEGETEEYRPDSGTAVLGDKVLDRTYRGVVTMDDEEATAVEDLLEPVSEIADTVEQFLDNGAYTALHDLNIGVPEADSLQQQIRTEVWP